MTETSLVQALETRLINAWPAFEIEMADRWILRFAEGYSKRANAATPLVPGAALDEALVDHILRAFAQRGIPACFRLTGVEDPGADGALAARGLVEFDRSLGMVAPLGEELELDSSIAIRPASDQPWIDAAARANGGDKGRAEVLGRIVRSIRQPAAFATLSLDEEPAAWGLAVAERGYVGLYDIVVAPGLQGLGLGRRLVVSLMEWGRRAGAEQAYLQVRESNAVAVNLYTALGFTTAYRYTHRVLPGTSG